MSTLVYVHGTNGSGKSTLARAVLAAAGGPKAVCSVPGLPKAKYTTTHTPKMFLVGKYLTSCGGVDGILPYHHVGDILGFIGGNTLAEGLVTPGVATCQRFTDMYDRAVFILLDTPEARCIHNVLQRRKEAGNTKPYDPDNLFRKARSARSWASNIERAGLEVHRAQYADALRLTLGLLRLPPYDCL